MNIALKMSTRMAKRMHISLTIILTICLLPRVHSRVTHLPETDSTPLMMEEEFSSMMTTEFSTNAPLSTSAPVDCEGRSFGGYSVRNRDDRFFVCSVGGRIDFSCREGGTFDSATGRCEEEEIAIDEPPATQRSYCQRQPNGVHPDADDCRNFVVCFNGASVGFSCPEGEKFNGAIGRCAETDSELGNGCAGQPNGAYPVPNSDNILFFVCINGVRIGYLCREEGTFNSATGRCEEEEIAIDEPRSNPRSYCQRQPNGVHPDADDCRDFVVCFNGASVGFSCSQGQKFNGAIGRCAETDAELGNGCAGQPNGAYPVPNSDNILFFVCFNSARLGYFCREERTFNSANGRCEGAEIIAMNGGFCQLRTNGVYPDANDNQNFNVCFNGGRVGLLCGEGQAFNGATGRCADP